MWHKENDKSITKETGCNRRTDSIMVETCERSVKPIPSPLETLWANADERRDMASIGAQKNQRKTSGNNGNDHEHN